MTREQQLERALQIMINNLRGSGWDARPLQYDFACRIANLGQAALDGQLDEFISANQVPT